MSDKVVTGYCLRLDKVVTSYCPKTKLWTLEQDYFYIDNLKQVEITINRGSTYDLSSVPRIIWKLISPFDLSYEASLIHDALESCDGGRKALNGNIKGTIEFKEDNIQYYTLDEINELFLIMMKQYEVKPWRYYIAYHFFEFINIFRKLWNHMNKN